MVMGNVPVITNCEAEDVMPVMVTEVEPMSYTVKTWGVLTVPACCGENVRPVGSTDADVPAKAGTVAINIPQTLNRRTHNLPVGTA